MNLSNTLKNSIHYSCTARVTGNWIHMCGHWNVSEHNIDKYYFQDCTKNIYKYKTYWYYYNLFHSYWNWGKYHIMHKIIVPPSQPSTYYESRYRLTAIYHFGNFLIVLYTATIKYPFFSSTEQHALQHLGNTSIYESTGSVEFPPSPPGPYRCTWCWLLWINTCLPAASTLLYRYRLLPVAVQGQTQSDMERRSTRDKWPYVGADEEELRLDWWSIRTLWLKVWWRKFAYGPAAKGKPCYDL